MKIKNNQNIIAECINLTKETISYENKQNKISLINIQMVVQSLQSHFKYELNFINSMQQELNENKVLNYNLRLKEHEDLIQNKFFSIVNKKLQNEYFSLNQFQERFGSLIEILQTMSDFLKKNQKSYQQLEVSNQTAFKKLIFSLFPKELFQNEQFLRICSEVHKLYRNQNYSDITNQTTIKLLYQYLKLLQYGICLPSDNIEDYPLHSAIFQGDIPLIQKLCTLTSKDIIYCGLNDCDPNGYTPLLLAVKLQNVKVVKLLLGYGVCATLRTLPFLRSSLDEAIFIKNKQITKIMLKAEKKRLSLKWVNLQKKVVHTLKQIPDYSFKMKWEIDSSIIPFFSKFAPSDNYNIHKLGDQIRIDFTLLNVDNFNPVRGNQSVIFNNGNLYLIDHVKKQIYNLLNEEEEEEEEEDQIDSVESAKLNQQIESLFKKEILSPSFNIDDFQFQRNCNWLGEPIHQTFSGYKATKYTAKGSFRLYQMKKYFYDVFDSHYFYDFQNYFTKSLEECILDSKSIDLITSILSLQSDINSQNIDNNLKNQKFSKKTIQQKTQKKIECNIWLCQDFPLNFAHLSPFLDILTQISSNFEKLQDIFSSVLSKHKNTFPVKAIIPIMFSISAHVEFSQFIFRSPNQQIFELNETYRNSFKSNIMENAKFYNSRFDKAEYQLHQNDIVQNWKKRDPFNIFENDYIIESTNTQNYVQQEDIDFEFDYLPATDEQNIFPDDQIHTRYHFSDQITSKVLQKSNSLAAKVYTEHINQSFSNQTQFSSETNLK